MQKFLSILDSDSARRIFQEDVQIFNWRGEYHDQTVHLAPNTDTKAPELVSLAWLTLFLSTESLCSH